MSKVTFDYSKACGFVQDHEMQYMSELAEQAKEKLLARTGAGNDFLGWIDLPVDYDKDEFDRIKKAAEKIREDSEVLLVIGIGGSYLGARAAIEFLGHSFANVVSKEVRKSPEIYYVGNSISSTYVKDLIDVIGDRDFSINMISKSGTTTEPAIAFRVFKELLEKKYGKEEAAKRIYATTDKAKGALKNLATEEGYETFVVPDDVGGRYSVLTAVGLLPIAAAGCDIDALMAGAAKAREELAVCSTQNECYRYAAARNILYRKGKSVELMACYEPNFTMMTSGTNSFSARARARTRRACSPPALVFSTDLHSMGQFVQDGARIMFETVVDIKQPQRDLYIEKSADNFDGLDFLAGQDMSVVNRKAMEGTILAHTDGGVPNIILEVDSLTEADLGYLIYFFEKACAISGYMLGVNPFNQPGVESYKKNMFALLGKPGYEAQKAELEAKLR